MAEAQMDRFEGMLTQLVSMVGHIKVDLDTLKETQEKQHAQVMGKLELLRIDQELTWNKTNENEREINRLKKQVANL